MGACLVTFPELARDDAHEALEWAGAEEWRVSDNDFLERWLMREVKASATGAVAADIEHGYALLADVGRYPEWYPAGAKRVEVLERDDAGRATVVDALLSLGTGPIRKDFEMKLGVTYEAPRVVRLSRLASEDKGGESITVTWTLASAAAGETELTVAFEAILDLPPFLPINPIVEAVAQDFLAAAQAAVTA